MNREELHAVPSIAAEVGQLAERLHQLFAGYRLAHGHYDVTGRDEKGKAKGVVATEDGPATPELWRRHLSGTYGVGVVPMLENGTCFWGCVDLDIYDVDPARIAAQVKALAVPAIVCVSKSGGKHVFLWAKAPVPASLMRARLAELAQALGYPTAERFPKSDSVTECGGNWLNMPWYGGESSTRYAVRLDGLAYTITEFLDAAEGLKAATGLEWFSTPLCLPSAPDSGPINTQKSKQAKRRALILPDQITEGQRNSILTRYAGTLRRAGVNRDGSWPR